MFHLFLTKHQLFTEKCRKILRKVPTFLGFSLSFFSMSFEFYKNVQKKPNLFLTKTNFKRDANAGFLNVQFRLFRLQRLQVQVPQLQLQLPPKHSRHWCGKLARGSATTRSKVRLILPLTVTKNRMGLERCYMVFGGRRVENVRRLLQCCG